MRMTKQVKRQAKHLFRLCLVDGLLDGVRVRQVVQAVLESKRRNCLALAEHFGRLVRLDISEHSANVESARPLHADLQAGVRADLERLYGPGITTSFVPNPALIGGMRIKVGSDVYDGSVKARLAALEKQF